MSAATSDRAPRARRWRRVIVILVVVSAGVAIVLLCSPRLREATGRRLLHLVDRGPEEGTMLQSPRGSRTVDSVMAEIGPEMSRRWQERLAPLSVPWPPAQLTLIGLKEEKRLEVWAGREGGGWVFVCDYPIKAASGVAGPKLREGDRQVPEGVYCLEGLNPNSSYHLSMKVSYPRPADRERAERDGRTNLGGDIFIHGRDASIGCLAMGDPAIEELFTLVASAGKDKVKVLLAPHDCRDGRRLVRPEESPVWVGEVYAELERELAAYKR